MHVADQYDGLNGNIKNAWGTRIFAGLVTCAVHVGLASLMWFNQPTRSGYVASAGEPMFVEMLSTTSLPAPHAQAAPYSGEPIGSGIAPSPEGLAGEIAASEIQPQKKSGNVAISSR